MIIRNPLIKLIACLLILSGMMEVALGELFIPRDAQRRLYGGVAPFGYHLPGWNAPEGEQFWISSFHSQFNRERLTTNPDLVNLPTRYERRLRLVVEYTSFSDLVLLQRVVDPMASPHFVDTSFDFTNLAIREIEMRYRPMSEMPDNGDDLVQHPTRRYFWSIRYQLSLR